MKDLQAKLASLGYAPGPVDGEWGPRTKAAALAALNALSTLQSLAPQVRPQRTSARGVAAIAAHEGFVPGPYVDSVGVWTAYVGHTAAAGDPNPLRMPRGMPEDLGTALREGMAVFAHDLEKYEADVRRAFTRPLMQHQFDAAVSFHYNTGAIGRAEWVKAFNRGELDRAADQIMNWKKPVEIIPRRSAEMKLFRDGVYPTSPMVVWGVTEKGRVIWIAQKIVPASDVAGMVGR